MKTIRWRVEAISAPAALRPCGTCGAEARFESTGRFRVNSQKKRLDVWLIYRCATCGSVWNCAVISCGRPGGIGRERLERFMANDADLVLACALDTGLLKSNGARRGRINFVVEGDVPDDGEDCCVQIEAEGLAGIRLAEVLLAKLGLARRRLADLAKEGLVTSADGMDLLAVKLRPHQVVVVRARRG